METGETGETGRLGDRGDREGPQGPQGAQVVPGLPGPGLAKNSRNTYTRIFESEEKIIFFFMICSFKLVQSMQECA